MRVSSRKSVLVVDDSAVFRVGLSAVLRQFLGCHVDTASDALVALEKLRRARPDAVVLDMEMPRMDGIAFLRQVMATNPLPVVVCSAHTGKGTSLALQALELGAVSVLIKPRISKGEAARLQPLTDAVAGALEAKIRSSAQLGAAQKTATLAMRRDAVIVIGSSTGGTEALRQILRSFPGDSPPIIIAQHMPAGFTKAFAAQLNQECRLEVSEATDGEPVTPGVAYVAPGGKNTTVRISGGVLRIQVTDDDTRYRPSVNALFQSAAASASGVVAVILTGMGDDGAEGVAALRKTGGFILAQSEASCVVFGMPKAAIAVGVDQVVSLDDMAEAIARATFRIGGKSRQPG